MDQSSTINELKLKRKHLERQKSIDFVESEFNSFCSTLGPEIFNENNLEEAFEKKTALISVISSIVEKIETGPPNGEYVSEMRIDRRAIDGPVLYFGQKFKNFI
jgi:hypothetical protein